MNRMSRMSVVALSLVMASAVGAQDGAIAAKDGGIKVSGWTGDIDAKEKSAGQKIENSRLVKEGDAIHVTTGPQGAFWDSKAQKASGNYTVTATFKEPKFMSLMNHPHPYGLFIGGNDMGTENQTYLYCAAYGNGSFIVRGFGPAPFQMNGRGERNDAVNKAAGKDEPVTQQIALSVKGDKVECSINGTVVGTYDKAAVVGEGKLKSLDGTFCLRFGHNTEAMVSELKMTKK